MKVLIDCKYYLDFLKKNNLSNHDITKKCGVSNTTLNKIINGDEIPYLTARKIATALNTNVLLIIKDNY